MARKAKRAMIIGLDGAFPRIVRRMMAEGKKPCQAAAARGQGQALDRGVGAFLVQPLPENPGALREDALKLSGSPASGRRHYLLEKGRLYLRISP